MEGIDLLAKEELSHECLLKEAEHLFYSNPAALGNVAVDTYIRLVKARGETDFSGGVQYAQHARGVYSREARKLDVLRAQLEIGDLSAAEETLAQVTHEGVVQQGLGHMVRTCIQQENYPQARAYMARITDKQQLYKARCALAESIGVKDVSLLLDMAHQITKTHNDQYRNYGELVTLQAKRGDRKSALKTARYIKNEVRRSKFVREISDLTNDEHVDDIIRYLDEAVDFLKNHERPVRLAYDSYSLAEKYIAIGELAKALTLLEHIPENASYPRAMVYKALAVAYAKQGEEEKMLQALSAIKLDHIRVLAEEELLTQEKGGNQDRFVQCVDTRDIAEDGEWEDKVTYQIRIALATTDKDLSKVLATIQEASGLSSINAYHHDDIEQLYYQLAEAYVTLGEIDKAYALVNGTYEQGGELCACIVDNRYKMRVLLMVAEAVKKKDIQKKSEVISGITQGLLGALESR